MEALEDQVLVPAACGCLKIVSATYVLLTTIMEEVMAVTATTVIVTVLCA